MMDLRKAANHPLLLRHHYTEEVLQTMAAGILREPTHRDADHGLVMEDLRVMSDFELHNLCLKYEVGGHTHTRTHTRAHTHAHTHTHTHTVPL